MRRTPSPTVAPLSLSVHPSCPDDQSVRPSVLCASYLSLNRECFLPKSRPPPPWTPPSDSLLKTQESRAPTRFWSKLPHPSPFLPSPHLGDLMFFFWQTLGITFFPRQQQRSSSAGPPSLCPPHCSTLSPAVQFPFWIQFVSGRATSSPASTSACFAPAMTQSTKPPETFYFPFPRFSFTPPCARPQWIGDGLVVRIP